MITLTPPISYIRPQLYYATKTQVESVNINIFDDSTTCKNYMVCSDPCLPVFANLSNNSSKFNDETSHLYDVVKGGSVVATLSNASGLSTVISDDTYGSFYSLNTLKLKYWGFVMDWNKIATVSGFDKYNLTIVIKNVAGVTILEESFCYRLAPFSCEGVDGTVRLTTFKTGYIENGLDYRNLSIGEWKTQNRLYGSFKLDEEAVTVDNLKLNNGDLHQIQTQIIDNYNLVIKNISADLSKTVIKDDLLANKIYIDDYNNSNVFDYKEQYVSFLSIEKPIQNEYNGTINYIIKLTEYNQSTRKRNF
jgi:hypothetical protein